jgi:predicted AAA+ superfamily ATPase
VFGRADDVAAIPRHLRRQPVVGVLGPRQIGKTTVARALAESAGVPTARFDLEDPVDAGRLADAATALTALRGLMVIDEIQRRPELFPVLRVLADRPRRPATTDLALDRLDVIHVGKDTYPLTDRVRAVAFDQLHEALKPLR